jgi:thiol-disulfide isomerase/thioredoxin
MIIEGIEQNSYRLVIVNQLDESVHLTMEHWIPVPFTSIESDTLIRPGTLYSIVIPCLGPTDYSLSLHGQSLALFMTPGSADTLTLVPSGNTYQVKMKGGNRSINEFLQNRTSHFGSANAVWYPRAMATQSAGSVSELIDFNDSLTHEHRAFLEHHKNVLPAWYVAFENDRLTYINEGFKMNSVFYRNTFLDKGEQLPEGFLENLESSVLINNSTMRGCMRYYYFLNDYIHLKGQTAGSLEKPSSTEAWQTWFEHFDQVAVHNLSEEITNYYFGFSFSKRMQSMAYLFKPEWLSLISDPEIKAVITSLQNAETLPTGSPLPYFYLETPEGNYLEPRDVKNHVVLINFWATWCKPCLEEFPAENELVERFSERPVTILNICMDSEKDTWLQYIKKFDLKTVNGYANENWTEVLTRKFDIRGLPHSVLIDAQGKVLINKSPRASAGIEQLIEDQLTD